MRIFRCTLAVLAALSLAGCHQKGELPNQEAQPDIQEAHPHIKGEVFIATEGGESIRLGAVVVIACDQAEMFGLLHEAKDRAQSIVSKLSPYEAQAPYADCISYLDSEGYYAEYVAKCKEITSCTTDSDGKYDLLLPSPGKYAVVAFAHRYVGETAELYDWILSADASKGDVSLTLSNGNLCEAGGGESMITTGPWTTEVTQDKIDELVADAEQQSKAAQATPTPEATPQSTPLPEGSPSVTVDEWKRKAIEQYPELAVAGSPLNTAFVAKFKAYQGTSYFDTPDWPLRLAKECADAMPAK